MSLLDDLRRKAQDTKQSEALTRSTESARRDLALRKLLPKLESLYRYFNEVAEHLNVVGDDPVVRDYDVSGLGLISDLTQAEYRCTLDEPDRYERFSFRFACIGKGRFDERVTNPALARREADYLRNHGLRFKIRDVPGGGSSFSVEKRIPVGIEFGADLDREALSLSLINLGELGTTKLSVLPEQIDQAFMEELAKRILGEPERFYELVGYTIAEDDRVNLQHKLRREEGRRAAELKGPLAMLTWVVSDWVGRKLGRS